VWELIFLMVIMKIPIVYLCWVVYWAIKSEPTPEHPVAVTTGPDAPVWSPRRPSRGPRRNGPHGAPTRRYARTKRAAVRA
jgi:hypothetical protein